MFYSPVLTKEDSQNQVQERNEQVSRGELHKHIIPSIQKLYYTITKMAIFYVYHLLFIKLFKYVSHKVDTLYKENKTR